MKKISTLILLFISVVAVNAQKSQGWAGLSDMKSIMKQTFPPLMKENNLQPAKENAAKLYELAVKMEESPKPKAFGKKQMKPNFTAVTSLAKTLDELVKTGASDEEIKIGLVNLHAAFAEIAHHKKAGGKKH